MMTFEHIVQRWQTLPHEENTDRRQFRRDLCAPDGERGWFTACRAWVQDGPAFDNSHERLRQVIASLPTAAQPVARVHVTCARAARQALALLKAQPWQPTVVQALIQHIWVAIVRLTDTWQLQEQKLMQTPPNISALANHIMDVHWPSHTPSAATLVEEVFQGLRPSLGTPVPGAWATARDLTLELLDASYQPKNITLPGLFVPREGNGFVVDIQLDRIPHGAGCFAVSPAFAFVSRDETFRKQETTIQFCMQEYYHLWPLSWDVRWSLQRRDGQLFPLVLEGNSLGAAWALGVAKLAVME